MKKLEYDGNSIKSKRRNFLYCVNVLEYNQSCVEPLQTSAEYLYLKNGYIFPSDALIGKEIEVEVVDIVYGKVKEIKDESN